MKKERVRMLVESAMLLALAVVLELVSKMFIPEQTFGGQLTIVCMLPVVLISYRYGLKWGFFSAFVYAILEMAIGMRNVTAAFQPGYFGDEAVILYAFIMVLLDYLVAYTCLGLGGLFRNKIKNAGVSLMCGSIVALSCRYVAHILSGYVLFSGWAEWYFTQEGFPAWGLKLTESVGAEALGLIYSVVYNGMYMIPEIILTAVASLLIARVPKIVSKMN